MIIYAAGLVDQENMPAETVACMRMTFSDRRCRIIILPQSGSMQQGPVIAAHPSDPRPPACAQCA